jgi:3-oxoacyl-[acyl-carrier protein] reductase
MSRIVVVSGGGTGIGRAIARTLALAGDDVVIVGRRADVLAAAARQISDESPSGSVRPEALDLSSPTAVALFATLMRTEYGTVDAVVNNAGGVAAVSGSLAEIADGWRRTFDQNVLTAVLLTTALAPLLRRPGGRIVLISSMASRSGGGGGNYVAAKAALNGWVLALSTEFAPQGITANVVVPGYTPGTGLLPEGLPEEVHQRVVSRIAIGRPAVPEETAAAVQFFVSADASFVTGQVVEVSGGVLPPNL